MALESLRFIRSLQIADSFFPVGAFAYSDGLETAAAVGRVRDVVSLSAWMEHFLEGVFVPCEGLALVKCMLALKRNDLDTLRCVDEELTAIRPAAAVRASSTGIGKRLLSLYSSMTDGGNIPLKAVTLPYANAAAAYALVFFDCGIDERDSVLAFGYNRLSGIVSAALRLIPMGQQQGQTLLTSNLNSLPAAADRILEMKDHPLRSFNPLLDIEQMNHQYIYSRLFRS
ncbi:MAG TPA: urease accessory UreF family protein [Terriglobia bacterium]|nr:urease accessory UreF family protein [Terriglobia bacterium]